MSRKRKALVPMVLSDVIGSIFGAAKAVILLLASSQPQFLRRLSKEDWGQGNIPPNRHVVDDNG